MILKKPISAQATSIANQLYHIFSSNNKFALIWPYICLTFDLSITSKLHHILHLIKGFI
jgi:hypothetical protein